MDDTAEVEDGPALTLPTYCGSDPMYSSSTKNWFHTQPRFTLWTPGDPAWRGPAAGGGWGPAPPVGAPLGCERSRPGRDSSRS